MKERRDNEKRNWIMKEWVVEKKKEKYKDEELKKW